MYVVSNIACIDIHWYACHPGPQEFQVVSSSILWFQSRDSVGDVRCVTVDIDDDTKDENDEFFNFSIASRSRTQVTERINRITIIENIGNLDSEMFTRI